MTVDLDAVTRILDEASRTLVLPRFANLSASEVTAKTTHGDPDDVVTLVDHEVEEHLTSALTALAPTAAVLGEEAVHRRPELLDLLASDAPLWIVDPIDGTKNFAAGDTGFGIMIAWVVAGIAQAAWLVLPARRQAFVARRGGGAFRDGEPARVRPAGTEAEAAPHAPRGAVLTRYMPPPLAERVSDAMRGRYRPVTPSGCAAVEYTDVLRGALDFVVYHRLLPWDHAAPSLILAEAGGCVVHVGGGEYAPRAKSQLTVVARSRAIADLVLGLLDA